MKARTTTAILLLSLLLGLGGSYAKAAYINFHGETSGDLGTGFGNVLKLLVLQATGAATSESGSVTWDGTKDVLSGDAASQSQTQTVADIVAEDFDDTNLIVILNLNQTGSDPALDVYDFVMRFYTSSDGSSYFDAEYDPSDILNTSSTLGLTPEGQGTGSAGYVFRITFEGTEGTDFFAQDNHRVGMLVSTPFDNEANDGAENFYVGDADINPVIPEAATLVLLVLGSLLCVRYKTLLAKLGFVRNQ